MEEVTADLVRAPENFDKVSRVADFSSPNASSISHTVLPKNANGFDVGLARCEKLAMESDRVRIACEAPNLVSVADLMAMSRGIHGVEGDPGSHKFEKDISLSKGIALRKAIPLPSDSPDMHIQRSPNV